MSEYCGWALGSMGDWWKPQEASGGLTEVAGGPMKATGGGGGGCCGRVALCYRVGTGRR